MDSINVAQFSKDYYEWWKQKGFNIVNEYLKKFTHYDPNILHIIFNYAKTPITRNKLISNLLYNILSKDVIAHIVAFQDGGETIYLPLSFWFDSTSPPV